MGGNVTCGCTVTNTGGREGDEVLMAFDMLSPAIRAQVTLRQCLRLHLDAHARPTSHDAIIAHRLLHV